MEYLKIIFNFLGQYGVVIIIALIALIGLILRLHAIINGDITEWLIEKVAEAEIYFGSKTGKMKLRSVYDVFVKDRPFLSLLISFEKFSELVDIALEKFEKMLNEDDGIKEWFENLKKEKNTTTYSLNVDESKYEEDINPDLDVDINVVTD